VKNISLLGSTGSLGTQTLDIVRMHPDRFRISALSANQNSDLLISQAKEFSPRLVCIADDALYNNVKGALKDLPIQVVAGKEGLNEVASVDCADMVINTLVGSVGLVPTVTALKCGKTIGLANKESLVIAGDLVMSMAQEKNLAILPIDSEHNAIFQCIGSERDFVKSIILTASGGPFIRCSLGEMETVTPRMALQHPNWTMGKKITIDSATLMNKGFEVIEAYFLFGIDVADIEVLVHRQSIVHSLVRFIDGSILAQLGVPDMRLAIQYAMTYPDRIASPVKMLDLADMGELTFEKVPPGRFPCLALAYGALRVGGAMPAVLNAANEIAVQYFLDGAIGFLDIPRIIEYTMGKHNIVESPTLSELLAADDWARKISTEYYERVLKNKMR
jgi:1-deoxy-D-xylulose-5-phosphate reductoisomerase